MRAGSDEGRHRLVHADGRQQQRLGRPGTRTAFLECWRLGHSGKCGVFRFCRNEGGDGARIDTRDTPAATTVAVVNQTFVKDLFKPGENPIRRHFGHPGPDSTGDFEIVGVVEDTVYTSVRKKDHLMYFVPMMQRPRSTKQPIEKDDSLYLGAIVLQTDRPMNDMEKLSGRRLPALILT